MFICIFIEYYSIALLLYHASWSYTKLARDVYHTNTPITQNWLECWQWPDKNLSDLWGVNRSALILVKHTENPLKLLFRSR